MTTARAQLHAQLIALLQNLAGVDLTANIQSILSGYRLQFKSKTAVGGDQAPTARQALAESLQIIAAKKSVDLVSDLAKILDAYRMQHKAKAKPKSKTKSKHQEQEAGSKPSRSSGTDSPVPVSTTKSPGTAQSTQIRSGKKSRSEPVVARPSSRRGVSRSECPKCHSMGVVLARSYAEDEYYSCIYCGWQGFKVAPAGEEQDSLAARLLGIYKTEPESE